MKNVFPSSFIFLFTVLFFTNCDAIKILPTNTTGGLFFFNGTWRLKTNSNSHAMEWSEITLYPVVGNGTVNTIANNRYCVRAGDEIWKNVKTNNNGGFTNSNLIDACNGATVYKDGQISIVSNDEVTFSSTNLNGEVLSQTWIREK